MQLCQWAARFLCFSLIANVSLSFHRKSQGGSGVAGGSTRVFARPIPLAVARGKHITVDGISITNSPFWHSIIFESSYVTFKNIYMKSLSSNESAQAANTDGCKCACELGRLFFGLMIHLPPLQGTPTDLTISLSETPLLSTVMIVYHSSPTQRSLKLPTCTVMARTAFLSVLWVNTTEFPTLSPTSTSRTSPC
jgi:hypothetical protein